MTHRALTVAWTGVGAFLGLAGVTLVALATWVEVDAQNNLPGQPVIIPGNASQVCLDQTCAPMEDIRAWLKARRAGQVSVPVPRVPAPSAPASPSSP